MKCVLEFGVRGGQCHENAVIPTIKLAQELAYNIQRVLTNNAGEGYNTLKGWKLKVDRPRISWQSSTHYVSITLLDDVPRGPASAYLWKKENPNGN